MKHDSKIVCSFGLALLMGLGLDGCGNVQIRQQNSKNGNVDIHVDARDQDSHLSLDIKGKFDNSASKTVKQTYSATKVVTVKVVETSGTVHILPQDGNTDEITILATQHIRGMYGENILKTFLKFVKPTVKLEGDVLNIYTQRDEAQLKHANSGWVDYEVRVPQRIAAQVEVSSGNVKIEGIESKVTVATSSGEIELEHLKGEVHAKASSGDITLKNSDILDKLELEATSGKIEAEGVKADGLYVSLHTSSGEITYNGSVGTMKSETTSGNQSLIFTSASNFNGGEARASSGDIELTVPKDLKASLALKTSSGDISLSGTDKDATDGNEHKTTINGGGVPFTVEATSGDVTVEAK